MAAQAYGACLWPGEFLGDGEVSCREQGNVQDSQDSLCSLQGAKEDALSGTLKAKSALLRMPVAAAKAGMGQQEWPVGPVSSNEFTFPVPSI